MYQTALGSWKCNVGASSCWHDLQSNNNVNNNIISKMWWTLTDLQHFYSRAAPTILDKTVEKIVHLDSIFLNIVAVPVLPSPPSPESNVVVYSKESLIPGSLWEVTLNWGKGFSFRKGVVLEIVLLRRKGDMMGKNFSSSFVHDCSKYLFTNTLLQTLNKVLVILFRKTGRVVVAQSHKKSYTFTISFWHYLHKIIKWLKKVWKKYDGS